MGRYRSRSRSYSPRRGVVVGVGGSPSPRRKRYDDPRERERERYRGGGGGSRRHGAPSGLLVRNISLDARPEDLRIPFERFGPVKDVYLPKNYYTGEPRGFGFVKFRNPDDAAEAKQQMNHQIIGGREITIVFAEENRKTPQEMRSNARVGYGGGSSRRRSPPRSPRRRYRFLLYCLVNSLLTLTFSKASLKGGGKRFAGWLFSKAKVYITITA
ncbi:hypothetical protein ACLOJK_025148 [Asimina triloba]